MTTRIDRAIATLDAKMQEQWRAEFRRLQRACGCREAVAAMLIAAIGAGYFAYADPLPNVALTIGGAAFGGALIGKVAGLLFARIRLHVLLHKIEHS
jgi:hypothetical protein